MNTICVLLALAAVSGSDNDQLIDAFEYRSAGEARQVWLDHGERGRSQRVGMV